MERLETSVSKKTVPDDVKLLLPVTSDEIIFKIFHRHETISLRRTIHDVNDASRSDIMTNVTHCERILWDEDVQSGFVANVDGNIETRSTINQNRCIDRVRLKTPIKNFK